MAGEKKGGLPAALSLGIDGHIPLFPARPTGRAQANFP